MKPFICSACRPRATFITLLRRHLSTSSSNITSSLEVSPPSRAEIQRARQYALDLLRKYDTPSSLLLPYIPRHARDAYIALRAFNVEIARTADTTSTPTIGSMRLQFQREMVSKALEGKPAKQPIAILLAKAAEDVHYSQMAANEGRGGKGGNHITGWSKSWFMRIIETREKHLSNPPFPSLESLERYAENTYSTLLYLTLQALPMNSLTADHIASHIGKAAGIVAVLRGLPILAFPNSDRTHTNQGQLGGQLPGDIGAIRTGSVMLPLDIMAECGVREEDVLRNGSKAEGLRDAVFSVATRANDHLITARQMLTRVRKGEDEGHEFEHEAEEEGHVQRKGIIGGREETKEEEVKRAFGVYMPAVATRTWLQRLEKEDFDVFSGKLRVTDWRLPFVAGWGYYRRQI